MSSRCQPLSAARSSISGQGGATVNARNDTDPHLERLTAAARLGAAVVNEPAERTAEKQVLDRLADGRRRPVARYLRRIPAKVAPLAHLDDSQRLADLIAGSRRAHEVSITVLTRQRSSLDERIEQRLARPGELGDVPADGLAVVGVGSLAGGAVVLSVRLG